MGTVQENYYDAAVEKAKDAVVQRLSALVNDEGVLVPLIENFSQFEIDLVDRAEKAITTVPIPNTAKPAEPNPVFMFRRFKASLNRLERMFQDMLPHFNNVALNHVQIKQIDVGQALMLTFALELLKKASVSEVLVEQPEKKLAKKQRK